MSDPAVFETIDATGITMETLVGTWGEFPRTRGNCFSVSTGPGSRGYSILNFCSENLRELVQRGIVEWPVKIHPLDGTRAVIHDERIPREWYSTRFCEVCTPHDMRPLPQQLEFAREVLSGQIQWSRSKTGGLITTQRLDGSPVKEK